MSAAFDAAPVRRAAIGQGSRRQVLLIVGVLLVILGIGMVIPALCDLATGHPDWSAFLGSAAVTVFVGAALALTCWAPPEAITVRQTFLLTTLSWLAACAFGALPFVFSSYHLSYTDAFFETVSGLSTTGATVMVGLDQAPAGLLIWRSLLTWLGGIGIIVMAIVVLPFLRVGGMQLFRTENSDNSQRPFAQVRRMALAIVVVYLLLTMASAVGFRIAGMGAFDALNHGMTAIATGGFSTKDTSLGWFGSLPILWVATVSMLAGALPLTWYIRGVMGPRDGVARDNQVLALLAVTVLAVGAMTAWAYSTQPLPFAEALSHSALNVVSMLTATGFVSIDYGQWGGFAVVLIFCLYFVGGCTGSTTGSVKIFRWYVLAGALRRQILRMMMPNRIHVARFNGRPVGEDVAASVANFVIAYFLSFGVLSLAVSATGLDLLTSISAVAACLAGAGPGLGPLVGPAGNYQPLPGVAKWLLCFAMLLGRLEIFTILVLLSPSYWRR